MAGTVASVGWAPVALPVVCLFGYAVLFGVLKLARSAGQGLAVGAVFALGLHCAGHRWVFDALQQRAQADAAFAALGSVLFITYLAVFTAGPAALTSLWQARHRGRQSVGGGGVLFFAALLTLGEWVRSLLFNGVTGLSLGYALVPTTAAGWLPVAGVYGVSFMAYATAAAIAESVRAAFPAGPQGEGMATASGAVIKALAPAAFLFGGGAAWTQYGSWVQPAGPALSFRLIQSQVDPRVKFEAGQREAQVAHFVQALSAAPADLIVTPETALPVHAAELGTPFWGALTSFAQQTGSQLFVGEPSLAADGRGYNSLFHVASVRPQLISRYDKVDLMPVGEYAPAGLGWFTRHLTLGLTDLNAGDPHQPAFQLPASIGQPPVQVGALVCHEDGRGRNLLRSLPAANVFINPTDPSWFEGGGALEQGLQIAQARALESSRPLLRTANTGITAHIDHRGRVVSRLAPGRPGVLSGAVQPMAGTPYARFGDAPAVAACLLIAGLLARPRRRVWAQR